jgi:polyphosphate kinase 2 (PPK2 family)
MLEQLDLTRALTPDEYRARMKPLKFEMYELGRAVYDSHTPVIIVFEGWGTAGKGRAITELAARLDPRGFSRSKCSRVRARIWSLLLLGFGSFVIE